MERLPYDSEIRLPTFMSNMELVRLNHMEVNLHTQSPIPSAKVYFAHEAMCHHFLIHLICIEKCVNVHLNAKLY